MQASPDIGGVPCLSPGIYLLGDRQQTSSCAGAVWPAATAAPENSVRGGPYQDLLLLRGRPGFDKAVHDIPIFIGVCLPDILLKFGILRDPLTTQIPQQDGHLSLRLIRLIKRHEDSYEVCEGRPKILVLVE